MHHTVSFSIQKSTIVLIEQTCLTNLRIKFIWNWKWSYNNWVLSKGAATRSKTTSKYFDLSFSLKLFTCKLLQWPAANHSDGADLWGTMNIKVFTLLSCFVIDKCHYNRLSYYWFFGDFPLWLVFPALWVGMPMWNGQYRNRLMCSSKSARYGP